MRFSSIYIGDVKVKAIKYKVVIRVGFLGAFQIGVRSVGVATPEEVTVNLVKKSHINFRPDKRLRKMLQNVEFTHSES
ncbi:hypothetical protein [Polaribacter reichenbachii]|uniref:HU family DNA-binding protein n=1 Tax=Polaribacter reichenbachii TaxID=996801 RepID=UPI0013905BE1